MKQLAILADPDNDHTNIRLDTSLLLKVSPITPEHLLIVIGEVRSDLIGFILKARTVCQAIENLNYQFYKAVVLKRRNDLTTQGFIN